MRLRQSVKRPSWMRLCAGRSSVRRQPYPGRASTGRGTLQENPSRMTTWSRSSRANRGPADTAWDCRGEPRPLQASQIAGPTCSPPRVQHLQRRKIHSNISNNNAILGWRCTPVTPSPYILPLKLASKTQLSPCCCKNGDASPINHPSSSTFF